MPTFLPYPNFAATAAVLDARLLGVFDGLFRLHLGKEVRRDLAPPSEGMEGGMGQLTA